MKVYIASKYLENSIINRKIHRLLLDAGIASFLPETIDVDAISSEEERIVGNKCYNELKESDIIIFVSPYGDSVIAEVGAAIYSKFIGNPKTIILFGKQRKNEAMISPYIDFVIDNEECRSEEEYHTLIQVVKQIVNDGET